MRWVLGFAFDHHGRVALIHKRDKDGVPQRGTLNGLGGSIKDGESTHTAMRREFREESGVDIEEGRWREFGTMSGKDWTCAMFVAIDPAVQFVATMTDEPVRLFARHQLPYERLGDNVEALILLASLPDDQRPYVRLSYKD